ncbi:MAG TPA: serine--tRNA ligase [Candidatus Nanoarchaeia archaeon]|nr:serine--tRNA ligase [Candidatus Nanoarchaeia archaeon]
MLDIDLFRTNASVVKESQKKRNLPAAAVDWVISLDEEWRAIIQKVEKLKHQRNEASEAINAMKKAGKPIDSEIKKVKKIAEEIGKLDTKANELKDKRDKILLEIPNLLDSDVPLGRTDADNKEIKKVGKPAKFNFEPKHHQDILEALDCLDMEQAAKVAGARFYYLKGQLVKLNQALINFALDFLMKKGFTPLQPPYMLNRAAMSGAVHISAFEDAIYKIQDEDLYMIATAEHPVAAYMKDKIIPADELPLHFSGVSPCFRREAGTHGKDTKGIFRVHQFEKVEQFSFCKPSDVKKEFDFLLNNAEDMLKALEIPYRLIILSSGDTGKKDAKTIDFEGWFPSQGRYRELGSCSNLNDYQGRRSNVRFKEGNQLNFAATLNNTGIATERTMACIVENNQQKDGSIKIPKALWSYTGFKEVGALKPKK